MEDEHGPPPGMAPEPPAADAPDVAPAEPPSGWVAESGSKPGNRPRHLQRIGVGALVSILFLAVAYGPPNVVMLLLLAVVCTAGVGLIPIAFVSWIVGWVVIAAWQAFRRRRQGASSAP